MRKMPADQLADMKEEAMAKTFGASRDTCRNARKGVLPELKFRQIPTIDK
jgi:hypothetical protein